MAISCTFSDWAHVLVEHHWGAAFGRPPWEGPPSPGRSPRPLEAQGSPGGGRARPGSPPECLERAQSLPLQDMFKARGGILRVAKTHVAQSHVSFQLVSGAGAGLEPSMFKAWVLQKGAANSRVSDTLEFSVRFGSRGGP